MAKICTLFEEYPNLRKTVLSVTDVSSRVEFFIWWFCQWCEAVKNLATNQRGSLKQKMATAGMTFTCDDTRSYDYDQSLFDNDWLIIAALTVS